MRLFPKPPSRLQNGPDLRDDRLNFLIGKLGIGGTNAMNITWEDLANILVFLLEAEARRMSEAEPSRTETSGRAGNRAQG